MGRQKKIGFAGLLAGDSKEALDDFGEKLKGLIK